MKIVINACYGGFGLSHKAVMRYAEIKGIKLYPWIDKITKKVYGKRAILSNPEICPHYATKPIKDEADYEKRKDKNKIYWGYRDIPRNDPALVQVVEELGNEASGNCSKLEIVKIPDGVEFEIEEYDGIEWVSERHRTWR